jgi:GDP-L-fucose synthase
VVFLAAARVGGIMANMTNQAAFLYENLTIQNNVMNAASVHGVREFVFLSTSCVYPRMCPQPMKCEYLLTGPFEPTNEGYAIAKMTGMKLLEYYRNAGLLRGISAIPCNLYGPNDNYDLENGHVIASLVRRFVEAARRGESSVTLWGTGEAYREFLHVDDLADAILFVMEHSPDCGFINVGSGSDIRVRDLAELIASAAGFDGDIAWDADKPDGMPRKCLDVSRLASIGWKGSISLADGIKRVVEEYTHLSGEAL